eukprot:3663861-Pleurochrysis_carterae.AAC.3
MRPLRYLSVDAQVHGIALSLARMRVDTVAHPQGTGVRGAWEGVMRREGCCVRAKVLACVCESPVARRMLTCAVVRQSVLLRARCVRDRCVRWRMRESAWVCDRAINAYGVGARLSARRAF